MFNVTMDVRNKMLTLCVDLGKEGGPSKSGKTTVVATTHGNALVPGFPDIRLGLNVYKRKQA